MSYSYRSQRASGQRRGRNNYRSKNTRSRKPKGGGSYINPSRFIKVAKPIEEVTYEPVNKFHDFALDALLHKNLGIKGYEVPSPIQDQAIPAALRGDDIVGIASTGTGKTAAFALPVLHNLINDRNARALVIAPTRELAQQINQEFQSLSNGSNIRSTVLIGGARIGRQLRDLQSTPQLVIGTPGRIKDHLERGTLKLHNCNMIVLDEVDRMLDMGFVHDVTRILSRAAQQRQSLFFSATLDQRVQALLQKFANNPVEIKIQPSATSDNIHQDVVRYQTNNDKLDKLHDLLITEAASKVIVFNETKRAVDKLSKELSARGFTADAIHGGKSQGQRQRALRKFKTDEISVLVATDVAARGIDVADVSHVVNFSIPREYEDYIHRIGRTGRAGQTGYAYTFIPHNH